MCATKFRLDSVLFHPKTKLAINMTISNLILLCVWLAVVSVAVCETLSSFPFREQTPAAPHTNGHNISHYNSELQRRLITKERKLIEKTYGSLDNTNRLVLKLDKEYTPFQIADYIFTTGDEKGISRLFTEMINEGQIMASGDDIIRFLEQVRTELERMKELQL